MTRAIALLTLLLACNGGQDAAGGGSATRDRNGPSSRTTSGQATARPPDHAPLDAILKACVRDERVDYLTIRRDHWPRLVAYLDALSRVDDAALGRSERLAFAINLYNASMIRAVIERLRVGWSPKDSGFAVFKEKTVGMRGRRISLDDLEHRIIRKELKEPRVHVALVCGAESCPPLLPRAYRAGDLERVLEANMRRFVRDPSRNPIDVRQRKLVLSRIFEWFADDFGGRGALPGYVSRYHGLDAKDWPVSFTPYSWKLNLARPGSGEWVSVKPSRLTLGASGSSAVHGTILFAVSRKGPRVTVRVPFGAGSTAELAAGVLERW